MNSDFFLNLPYVVVGCQELSKEVIPPYIKSREEGLFPNIPKRKCEGFSKKVLRAAEELFVLE